VVVTADIKCNRTFHDHSQNNKIWGSTKKKQAPGGSLGRGELDNELGKAGVDPGFAAVEVRVPEDAGVDHAREGPTDRMPPLT